MTDGYREHYRGRRVMITGGLGFIGSNLAHTLVDAGADVLLVDALVPDTGGNRHNIREIESRVGVHLADLRDRQAIAPLVAGCDVVFNLAGLVSHIDSMRDPELDLEMNCRAPLALLEACRSHNPRAKVVYAGTRQVYGRPTTDAVNESHAVLPTDVNGVHKAAGDYYHLVYHAAYGFRSCSLRLTNVYGPRQLLKHNRQGFIGWFIRQALEGKAIEVYGDGSQERDLVFVDDISDAFLRAGASDAVDGEVFNVGGLAPVSLRDLAALIVETAGTGTVKFVEWPPEKRAIDIGSFASDWSKFQATVGWRPTVALQDGLRRTIDFYRRNLAPYLEGHA